jgi:branched-chain amino acid aminotransferase
VWKTKEGKLQLVTAPLDAKVILAGVTRGSVLELARQRLISGSQYLTSGFKELEVVERNFTMMDIEEAWKEGRIVEAFLSGTAYFITPVSAINFRDEEIDIPMGDGTSGYYAALLKNRSNSGFHGIWKY